MRRKLLFVGTVSLAVLALVTCVFWSRSYRTNDSLYYEHGDTLYIQSLRGGLLLCRKTNMNNGEGWYHSAAPAAGNGPPARWCEHSRWGFGYTSGEALIPPAGRLDEVAAPYWFVVGMLLM